MVKALHFEASSVKKVSSTMPPFSLLQEKQLWEKLQSEVNMTGILKSFLVS